MAESIGFEPMEPFSSEVFKTTAIDHSANSPFTTYYILICTTCQPLFKKVGWGGRIRTSDIGIKTRGLNHLATPQHYLLSLVPLAC